MTIKPIIDKLKDGELRGINDNLIDSIPDRHFKDLLTKIYFVTGKGFAKAVWGSLLKADFSDNVYLHQVEAIVEMEGAMLIKGMTESSREIVRRIIRTEIAHGLSIQETVEAILGQLNSITTSRAFTIARTETIRASNLGAMRGAFMTGLDLKKEWIPTLDGRTRGQDPADEFDHISMQGVIVNMNSPFRVSGEFLDYPLDFSGSAGNTINCRCAVAFIRE